MVTFDPTQPALVHDQINDRIVEWKPEWASTWPDRSAHAPGVVEWDGLLLTMGAGVRVGRAGARRG